VTSKRASASGPQGLMAAGAEATGAGSPCPRGASSATNPRVWPPRRDARPPALGSARTVAGFTARLPIRRYAGSACGRRTEARMYEHLSVTEDHDGPAVEPDIEVVPVLDDETLEGITDGTSNT
jgi:hypothetical protein